MTDNFFSYTGFPFFRGSCLMSMYMRCHKKGITGTTHEYIPDSDSNTGRTVVLR